MIHPQFEAILRDRDYCYYVYRVPLNWIADLKLFKKGKYSEMSELAKDTIRVQSGLPNNTRMSSGKLETDIRILALDKHKTLKNWWEEMINPWEPLSGELLSIPDERSFIELDLLTPETGYMPIHKPSH